MIHFYPCAVNVFLFFVSETLAPTAHCERRYLGTVLLSTHHSTKGYFNMHLTHFNWIIVAYTKNFFSVSRSGKVYLHHTKHGQFDSTQVSKNLLAILKFCSIMFH